MIRTGLLALLSHWWRHPLQFLTLFLGLALATALWSGVQAINTEARASYARAAQALDQSSFDQITATRGNSLSQSDYIALRKGGWQVAPILEAEYRGLRLVGIDPLSAPLPASGALLGGDVALLDFITLPGIALVNPADASEAQAIFADIHESTAVSPGSAIVDIGVAQAMLGQSGNLTRLLVLPDQPLRRMALPPHLVQSSPQADADITRLTDSFHLNLTAFGLLSFAVGLFIVHSAIGLAFEQRRTMFRTLRALGLPLQTLVGLVLAELLIIALGAGLFGIALGYLIASALLPDVAATLRGLYGADVAGTLQFRAEWWLSGVAIAVLGTLAASAAALWRLARLPLLAPAQPRAWARASVLALRWQAALAAMLAALALILGLFGSGLVAGFALLGAMLIAAALLLPVVLHLILATLRRRRARALMEWFWADTAQQLPGLSLALMALMLALAANIGVGTMVSSFRQTFTGWLDQRLAAELYVRGRDAGEAGRLQTFLASRSDAVLPIWHTTRNYDGQPIQLYSVNDHPTYRENWPTLALADDAWSRLADGKGVFINEQMARRGNLWPGDALNLPGDWQTRVLGVYSDYGNTTFQVLMAIDRLTDLYSDINTLRFAVRVEPDQAAILAREIREEFDLPPDNLILQPELKAFSLAIFERTFTVTGALNVLTFGVAGFALLTSLLTLAAMRLPQLAPVWAMGLTRRRLAVLELVRALLLAALTALYALPVGLALAWILLSVINVSAFGWQLPMFLFPLAWGGLLLLAVISAALAALWPSWRLSRLPPSDLLRVFANER